MYTIHELAAFQELVDSPNLEGLQGLRGIEVSSADAEGILRAISPTAAVEEILTAREKRKSLSEIRKITPLTTELEVARTERERVAAIASQAKNVELATQIELERQRAVLGRSLGEDAVRAAGALLVAWGVLRVLTR